MAFDRASAKAAGYSDQEIEAYLGGSQANPAEARMAEPPAPAGAGWNPRGAQVWAQGPGSMSRDEILAEMDATDMSGQVGMPMPTMGPVAIGAAAGQAYTPVQAAIGAAKKVGQAISRVPALNAAGNTALDLVGQTPIAKALVGRRPITGFVGHYKEAKAARGAAAASEKAAGEAAKAGAAEAEKRAAAKVAVDAYDKAKAAKDAARAAAKANPAEARIAPKPKPANPAETRVAAKAKASNPAEARVAKPMQGASKPELARRATARAKATGKTVDELAPGLTPEEIASETGRIAPKNAGTRHDVQYFSKSKGNHVNIEDMNQKHIESAFRKLAGTNPKPGSVAAKQLKALLDESIHRLNTTGIHIGQ